MLGHVELSKTQDAPSKTAKSKTFIRRTLYRPGKFAFLMKNKAKRLFFVEI